MTFVQHNTGMRSIQALLAFVIMIIYDCTLLRSMTCRGFPLRAIQSAQFTLKVFASSGAAAADMKLELKKPILGYTEIVKKSKFVVFAGTVRTEREVTAFLQKHQDVKATHNCWAYRLSDEKYRSSDDGEPSGTAGRPILTAIDAVNMQGIVVMVTRCV